MKPISIKSWFPLDPDFVPTNLPARDKELGEMIEQTADPLRRNLYVSGPRGVGKTVTAKRFLFELKARNPEIEGFYVPIRKTMSETWNNVFPDASFRTRNEAYILIKTPKPHVIFDDVTTLSRRTYLDKTLYTIYEGSHGHAIVILIGTISLYTFTQRFLSEPVQSRYQFRPVSFAPYKLSDIISILEQRLSLAVEGDIDKEAIQFIAKKTERHASDMRLGMRLLRNALNLAITRNSPLSELVAEMAWEEEKLNWWEKQYRDLHPHKGFLLYLFFCLKTQQKHVSSRQLYSEYYAQCAQFGIDPMTTRQLSTYLDELQSDGFINRQIDLKPRIGRIVKITSDLDTEMMTVAGGRITWVEYVK